MKSHELAPLVERTLTLARRSDLPQTDGEWQEAVDLAHVWLLVESARMYGLVSHGLDVDTGRCKELLKLGRDRGVRPSADAAERIVPHFLKPEAR